MAADLSGVLPFADFSARVPNRIEIIDFIVSGNWTLFSSSFDMRFVDGPEVCSIPHWKCHQDVKGCGAVFKE